jgi:hypothetical protein
MAAVTSSTGGSGLILMEAGFDPTTPIRKRRIQIEFTQASFRLGSLSVA